MPVNKRLNGGVRRDHDRRKIRYASDCNDRIGFFVFHDDEDPGTAAALFAKMSGRILEIFEPEPEPKRERRFGANLKYFPVEHLTNLGVVTDRGDVQDPEPAAIDFENLH
jgi:hypothetical protein